MSNRFTKEDYEKYRGFKSIVEQSDLTIKGKAVMSVAMLTKWFLDLENRIKMDLLPAVPAAPVRPKKVKPPITKVE